jgi:hypothetical protein
MNDAIFYTVLTRFNADQIVQPGFHAMSVVRDDGLREATRRRPGAATQLISVAMSDDLDPGHVGLTVLSRWRLAPLAEPALEVA